MKILFDLISIETAEYYGRKDLWPFMDEMIFAALETSFVEGRATTRVRKDLFDQMIFRSKLDRKIQF